MSADNQNTGAQHRLPRTTEAATAMLERYALLAGQRADREEVRQAKIAEVNAEADGPIREIVDEMALIAEKIEQWWARAGNKLLTGKRKSIELGGCMIGSVSGRATLAIAGDEEAVIKALKGLRWAKLLLQTRTSIVRAVAFKETEGKRKDELARLGITRKEGEETFFLKRAEQGGTMGAKK